MYRIQQNKRGFSIFKKQPGTSGIFNFVPMVLCVILCGYLLIACGNYMRYLDTLTRIENITKKYLLIMESENGMSHSAMAELYVELNQLGIRSEDIDLSGTSFASPAISYGDEMVLNLKVQLPYNELSLDEHWNQKNIKRKKEVEIRQCTLALGSS